MKKINYIILLFSSLSVICLAQQTTSIEKDIELKLRSVADNIISKTSYLIIDKETGQTYTSTQGLEPTLNYRIESTYNEWNYCNGVLTIGMTEMYNALGDDKYLRYAQKNIAWLFDNGDYFKQQYDIADKIEWDYMLRFRMEMLDDCGAMGAGIMEVNQYDTQKRYRQYLDKAAHFIINDNARLEDGTYCRPTPYPMTVWGDDLYMSLSFLCRYAELTGDKKYYDEAIKQVVNFHKHLWNPTSMLYRHGYYADIQKQSLAYWGRANGWIMMAQIDLLDRLPQDHPKRNELIRLLQEQIISLSRVQDNSGLWHQLLDFENSFLETSASAMFVYGIAKASNMGWIDQRYKQVAAQGWKGLAAKIKENGEIEGIVMGTGLGESTNYYLSRETPLNDTHGLGAIFLAGIEVMKMYKSGVHSIW